MLTQENVESTTRTMERNLSLWRQEGSWRSMDSNGGCHANIMYMVDEASDHRYGEDDHNDKHSEDDNENDGEDYNDNRYGEDYNDDNGGEDDNGYKVVIDDHRSWTRLAATVRKGRGPRRIEVR